MSHFSEVKTQINQKDILFAALKKLGLKVRESEEKLPIRGFMGDCAEAQICVDTGINYDLGFQINDQGFYDVVADFEVLESTPAKDLKNKILQTYAHLHMKKVAEEQGFQVEEEVQEDGQIQMVVTKW